MVQVMDQGATEMTQDKGHHGDDDHLYRWTHGAMMPQGEC